MIDPQTYRRVAAALAVLQRADAEVARAFQRAASLVSIAPGKDVFVQCDRIEAIPLLVSGTVGDLSRLARPAAESRCTVSTRANHVC